LTALEGLDGAWNTRTAPTAILSTRSGDFRVSTRGSLAAVWHAASGHTM
jgi:hypothetical protein